MLRLVSRFLRALFQFSKRAAGEATKFGRSGVELLGVVGATCLECGEPAAESGELIRRHAVLFWKVVDPMKAALDVADYRGAINWAAQTALRDVIGKTVLSDMLERRAKISTELQKIIDERTEPWGINVISVEVKDVLIPPALEDAMPLRPQPERERQARVILGDSERQIAEKFVEAANPYASNPNAFHLRAMNMLYEGLKQNSTIVIVPSTAVESMQLGSIAGLTALTMGLGQEGGSKPVSAEPAPQA